jgi:hypothetical protein
LNICTEDAAFIAAEKYMIRYQVQRMQQQPHKPKLKQSLRRRAAILSSKEALLATGQNAHSIIIYVIYSCVFILNIIMYS